MGALRLGELCAAIEVAGTAGDLTKLTSYYPALNKRCPQWTVVYVHCKRAMTPLNGVREAPMNALDPASTGIVLLDDDPFMLKLLTHMLAQLGYTHVVACDSGEKALEQVSGTQEAVDLIFWISTCPGWTGSSSFAGWWIASMAAA